MAPNEKLPIWPDAARTDARRSVLVGDLVIEGDVSSEGPVDVQGKLVGSARAPDVVVATTGRVEGSVNAHDPTVLGFISGSISARDMRLAPTAAVHADVLHERIAIEAGAELEGRLQRKGG